MVSIRPELCGADGNGAVVLVIEGEGRDRIVEFTNGQGGGERTGFEGEKAPLQLALPASLEEQLEARPG